MGVTTPSQAFIDATASRRHRFSSPTEWNDFALMWESSGITAQDTATWVGAGAYYPQTVTAAIAAGISPEEIALLKDVIEEQGMEFPDLQGALAICLFSAILSHFSLSSADKASIYASFVTRATEVGITFAPAGG